MSLAVPEPTGLATAPTSSAPALLTEWASAASAAHQLAAPLIRTDFVPAHFRPKGNSEDAIRVAEYSATAAVLMGSEVGLSPMQSLQSIYVISGRPSFYARAMVAITLAAGHQLWTEESTDNRAIVCGQRRGSDHIERVVVTMDMARKAGWTSNKKYQTEPGTQLLARAQSQAARRVAPDALAGIAYSAEELEDQDAPVTTVRATREAADPAAPKRLKRAVQPVPDIPEPSFDEPPAPTVEAPPRYTEAEPEPADSGEAITAAQSRKLHAALNEHGMGDRTIGLAYIADTLGREVASSKDLTRDDASKVIDALEKEPIEATLDDAWPAPAEVPA